MRINKQILVTFWLSAMALNVATAQAADRIVKWVDSQGVTHYGDKMPAQEAGRNNSEMSKQGVVVKQNVTAAPKNDQNDAEKLAQQRKDNVLLASYTNPEEIDLARDRSLQMDQVSIDSWATQRQAAAARLAKNQKTADALVASKKPVPAYLAEELKLAKSEVGRLDKQISVRKTAMDATKKRFEEDRARFVALKTNAGDAASVAPAATPAVPGAQPAPMATAGAAKK